MRKIFKGVPFQVEKRTFSIQNDNADAYKLMCSVDGETYYDSGFEVPQGVTVVDTAAIGVFCKLGESEDMGVEFVLNL